jgi:hypothetical protein
MKKIIAAILTSMFVACVVMPEQKAEAQVVVYTNRCCDSNNVIRCFINPPTVMGYGCFCYGQGYGYGC